MAGTMGIRRGVASLVIHMLLSSFNTPLLEVAKVDGKFPFETTLLPFLIEAIKLGVSVVLLAIELGGARVCGWAVFAELTNLRNLAKYAVPALLYIVVNNLNVVMLLYSSPVEVMMLGQLRVLFTAGFSAVILQKSYSTVQWASLLLLVTGSLELQLPSTDCDGLAIDNIGDGGVFVAGVIPKAYAGYILNVFVCIGSAAASVYSQVLLRSPESIHLSNIKMYSIGTVLSGLTYGVAVSQNASPTSTDSTLTAPAALYIANMVAFGLAVSHLLKELGAVVKLFSTAASACLVVVYSAILNLNLGRNSGRTMAFAGAVIFTALFIFVSESERRAATSSVKGQI